MLWDVNSVEPKVAGTPAPGWLTILGLSADSGIEWERVRAAQITALWRAALVRLAFSAMAAGIVFDGLKTQVASPLLFGWFALVILISGALALPALRQRQIPRFAASRSEIHRENVGLFASGLAWAALPLVLGLHANAYQLLVIFAALTVLMGGATFALSVAPLGAASFLLLTGAGLSWLMWRLDVPMIALLTLAYTTALTAASLSSGRSFILRKHGEFALREKSEVVSLLLREHEQSGGDWMWQTDTTRCLTHVTPRFAAMLRLNPAALEAKPFMQILAGDSWEQGNFSTALRELAEKMKGRQSFSALIIPIDIAGESHWWEISGSPRFDDGAGFSGYRGVISDVTEQRLSAEKITHMARFDPLTGMPNRLQMVEALGVAMREAEQWRRKCGIVIIDLDRFKPINDTLGHAIGDRLLVEVSQRLTALTTANEICARLGADEFAMIVKEVNEPGYLMRLAQAIITSLSRPYEIDQHTLYVGASTGTAVSPRDGNDVETLIRSADLALYRSKSAGGNSHTAYEPELHVNAEERRVLELALRKALERDELSLHYQPVVNAKSGLVESFEALLRWTNADLGNVAPARFIPIAEEARLIRPIGEWVLRTACHEAMNWPATVRVAVNVSAEQLHDPHFISILVSALSQTGLAPNRLELEVTESIFLNEGTVAIETLEKVLAMGVRLALDDFGTGYSSLGYLSRTRFSTIKVDRSFVQSAAKKAPESIAIIRAVVALADSLGMATTAEGVETDEECKMVNALGCTRIQGYLFGRPMPAHEARKLFGAQGDRAVA